MLHNQAGISRCSLRGSPVPKQEVASYHVILITLIPLATSSIKPFCYYVDAPLFVSHADAWEAPLPPASSMVKTSKGQV